MTPTLALILVCLSAPAAGQYWVKQRDNLAEYQLTRAIANVKSEIECMTSADLSVQAVLFRKADAVCQLFACQLGFSGCRKCRNARNLTLPELYVRVPDQLARSCWRTFQHRVDDSVDFYRNWSEYVRGFGQGEDLNYWMGLEAIHQLTQAGNKRARWEISMWNGSWWWWENSVLAVQGLDQGYRALLGSQDNASSNIIEVGFWFSTINNQMFSTFDKDQDGFPNSCAVQFHSGWWHNACFSFNPNGQYYTPPTALLLTGALTATGLTFRSVSGQFPFNDQYSMQTVECMVIDSPN